MGQDDIGSSRKIGKLEEAAAAQRSDSASGQAVSGPDGVIGDAPEFNLDPRIDQLIGRSLQAHYADIASTPLPDAILVMLAQLEAKEKSK